MGILTTKNLGQGNGILSETLVPRVLTPVGTGLATGAFVAGSVGVEILKARNNAKLGKVTYSGGPARMTSQFTSGVVPALMRASGGDYEQFAEMAEPMFKRGGIDNYGVTPKFVSALYNMGGVS